MYSVKLCPSYMYKQGSRNSILKMMANMLDVAVFKGFINLHVREENFC